MLPSKPAGRRREAWLAALVDWERRLAFLGRWGGRGALVVLIFTGEMLRFAEAAGAWPFQSGVLALHVMSGLAVALALAARGSTRLARALAWPQGWVWRLRGSAKTRVTLAAVVNAGFSVALLLLLLSGLQGYFFARHGTVFLPGLSLNGWKLAHNLIPPYFYTLALIRLTILFGPFWRDLRRYLYSP